MGERCDNCNRDMDHPELTHCSDECLFETMKHIRPIDEMPDDNWDSNPWV